MADVLGRLTADLADRYRFDRELGCGGMATVYLAQDLKHERQVAIKVLHEDLGATLGPERFLAEIKTTAKLQHPHILTLLDSGEAAGLLYYVMPYVEGESLRDRLTRETQLPIEDAVRIAGEVADALGHAHGHGIIHRDIKPENILLQGGHALVADFGIALAVQHAGGARLTQTGLSLGTPQYMAPEQAMGEKTVDHHADIYALGAVTYEMLTGEPPFTGATVQAIVAKVLSMEPEPPTTMRKTIPAQVEAAVLKALAKLPADRWASAQEFGAAVTSSGAISTALDVLRSAASSRVSLTHWRLASAALAVLALGLAAALVTISTRAGPRPRTARVEVEIGIDVGSLLPVVVGAPDGSSFVYCTSEGEVWRRRWESLASARILGSDARCLGAAFSPDGRLLAILGAPANLRVVSLAGDAPPRVLTVSGLADIGAYGGGVDWASDGNLYVASRMGLMRVSPADGHSEIVAGTDSVIGVFAGVDVLPGARAALVVAVPRAPTGSQDYRIGVVDLRAATVEWILQGIAVRYVRPDHLLIAREDGALAAVPFDLKSLRPSGPAVPLTDSVAARPGVGQRLIDVTEDGTLLFWRSAGTDLSHPVFVDRRGTVQELGPPWIGRFLTPRLSNDDALLAVEARDVANTHAWVRDLRSGRTTRLTADGSVNGRLTWTPDGQALTIVSDRGGAGALYRLRIDGGGMVPLPRYDPRPVFGATWSRDGTWLLLRTDDQAPGKGDILVVRPGFDSVAVPVLASREFSEFSPALSPDGRWLAFVSNESGRFEVRVTPFPDARGQWQISNNGGTEPLWSHTGRELFFISEGHLIAADIAPGPGFRVVGQRRLFPVAPFVPFGLNNRNFDVSSDDRRFLMLRRNEGLTSRIVAVFNWASALNSLGER